MCLTVLFYPLTHRRTHGANTQLQRIFLKESQTFRERTESISTVKTIKYEAKKDT